MKYSKKIRLISSLSIVVATTSLITTSCSTISKNSSNDTVTNGTNIANIAWVQRAKYDYSSSTTIQENIKNTVYNDNTSTFLRYPGLEDAISITVTLNSPSSGQATINIVATGDVYTGSTGWTSSYENQPLPAGGEIIINTDTIEDTIYVSTAAYDKQYEIFASTKINNVINAVNISQVDVTLSGSGITTASGSASSNRGYVNITVGTTEGSARLIIKVTDTSGNEGSCEVVIKVKVKWTTIYPSNFLDFKSGFSSAEQTALKVDRDHKRILGVIHVNGSIPQYTDTQVATTKSDYVITSYYRQAGNVAAYATTGTWWTHNDWLACNLAKAVTSCIFYIDYYYGITWLTS